MRKSASIASYRSLRRKLLLGLEAKSGVKVLLWARFLLLLLRLGLSAALVNNGRADGLGVTPVLSCVHVG